MKTRFEKVRKHTTGLCENIPKDLMSMQPRAEVSPPKWHLGHTTWFFEKVILCEYFENYQVYDSEFHFSFNSYYKSAGEHLSQADRGSLLMDCEKIYKYREYVDQHILELLNNKNCENLKHLLEIGINHEEQHQELLQMDLKAIYSDSIDTYPENFSLDSNKKDQWFKITEGLYTFGYGGSGFHYDNEGPQHQRYQYGALISRDLVTKSEYQNFISSGAYKNPLYWLSKGWDWVCENDVKSPLYWDESDMSLPVSHISFFEADAYANFMGCRLPSEFEHELLDVNFKSSSKLWAWTNSHYSAYPRFKKFDGVLSEYNGKFMCNQFVLRGGCAATPEGHWRPTYRNFYEPHQRWMYSGIRLAKDL
ncbi:MAG: SUMF1/EgtB/PvdO family nonheme iron enzyme [Bdellovibrionota bacterium]|mgnify:CR=1 FL=1|nr:sulfatase maturase [Pseudobdellovibrionaceae bacterium]|tara:strand:+ start:5324 stop:6415 length:1092 start_codon:yes stop_codon:yes gene_type:complete